jgi:rhamnulose-1-phosphate aldolase
MIEMTSNMYRMGWDERNGGNISYLLDNDVVAEYLDINKPLRRLETGFDAKELAGKIFIVTGTGKYFKNVAKDPETNLGVVRITEDGCAADLLWGYKDGGRFTSEFPAHMMSHIARLKANPENRVILHTHPTYTLAMTHVHTNDEAMFTHTLWKTCTECIVVFPDGVGVLPWMICGSGKEGEKNAIMTAEKMQDYRIVIWTIHGIYGAGKDMDEAFGLIETVEKGAELYLKYAHFPIVNRISDKQLDELATAFGINYRKDFLDL